MRKRRAIGGKSYFARSRKGKEPVISYSIRLYHGTDTPFKKPEFDRNVLPCDLGRGFYLTRKLDRAVSRAEEKALLSGSPEKWVLVFEFDDERAYYDVKHNKLFLKEFKEDKEWLDVVTLFWDDDYAECWERSNIEGIIISPSTDAKTGQILSEYRSSPRTEEDAEKALRELELEKYGTQYFFGSNEVIGKYLTYVGACDISRLKHDVHIRKRVK